MTNTIDPAQLHERIVALEAELAAAREEAEQQRTRAEAAEWEVRDLKAIDGPIMALESEVDSLRTRLKWPCAGCPGCSSNDCPDARHIAEILTAERDKTEAALLDLSNSVRDASHFLSRYGELAGHLPGRQEAVELFAEEMRRRGLWREPAKEPAS